MGGRGDEREPRHGLEGVFPVYGGPALFGLGAVVILLGVFAVDAGGVQATAIVVGAGLALSGVLWERLEGFLELGPSGLKANIAQAARENHLPAEQTRELLARVEALERPARRRSALAEALRNRRDEPRVAEAVIDSDDVDAINTARLRLSKEDRRRLLEAFSKVKLDFAPVEEAAQKLQSSTVQPMSPELQKQIRGQVGVSAQNAARAVRGGATPGQSNSQGQSKAPPPFPRKKPSSSGKNLEPSGPQRKPPADS